MCVCPALNAYCGQHRKPRSTIGYAKKLAFQVGISCNPVKKTTGPILMRFLLLYLVSGPIKFILKVCDDRFSGLVCA